jgi:hypothetical protein
MSAALLLFSLRWSKLFEVYPWQTQLEFQKIIEYSEDPESGHPSTKTIQFWKDLSKRDNAVPFHYRSVN